MICQGAVGCFERRKSLARERKAHCGRVGFNEQTAGGDDGENLAKAFLARFEEGAVEGKKRAEFRERRNHFHRAAVRMEQKSARREWSSAQDVEQRTERIETMDRSRQIAFRGERELPAEDLDLFVEWRPTKAGQAGVVGAGAIEHPAIEADFSN